MIIGIGTDIIEIERIAKSHRQYGDKFLNRIFTQEEIRYAMAKKDPYPSLAVRFAAKEALIKATREGKFHHFDWLEAAIDTHHNGVPHFRFQNALARFLENATVHVSLSHSQHYAAATVVIEKL